MKAMLIAARDSTIRMSKKISRLYSPTADMTTKLIAVIGARGGVGASTIAVNTAWLMAHEQNLRVAVVDLDLYFGTVALSLDLEPGRGFREALENPNRIDGLFIERALVRESDNLFILGAEEALENAFNFDPAAVELLLEKLRCDFDCVIVDFPRAVVTANAYILSAASAVVKLVKLRPETVNESLVAKSAVTFRTRVASLSS